MRNLVSDLYKKILAVIFTLLSVLGIMSVSAAPAYAECLYQPPTNLTAKAGPNPGEVILTWNTAPSATVYDVVYGFDFGKPQFGAVGIDGGPVPTYTVRSLAPGTRYVFQIWARCDTNSPAIQSNEVAFTAPR